MIQKNIISNSTSNNISGKYHCPMHCEGKKNYYEAGDCPVCGMSLVKEAEVIINKTLYTCPMHPEVISKTPGSCPICGMNLVSMEPSDNEDQKTYKDLVKKMKIAVLFTIPIFTIAMIDMVHNNPLLQLMDVSKWNWVQLLLSLPVVFYACWIFFVRAWKSIITWNLNMFTLIGIGSGAAFLFSLVGMFFPDIFPSEFKTKDGTAPLYFEATYGITLMFAGITILVAGLNILLTGATILLAGSKKLLAGCSIGVAGRKNLFAGLNILLAGCPFLIAGGNITLEGDPS